MHGAQRVVAYLTLAATGALLAGMLWRRYHRLCYTLPLYLLSVVVGDLLILLWPERFYTWTFWNVKESVYAVLKFAVAVELASLAFQAFPGARRTAHVALGLGFLLLLAAIIVLPIPAEDAAGRQIQPRLANGTAVLFAAVWGLALYYNIPLHPWHAAILRGFVPYLLVFTVAPSLTISWGWDVRTWASLADTGAYLAMLLYWCFMLAKPEPPPPADPEVVARLQPWRARLAR